MPYTAVKGGEDAIDAAESLVVTALAQGGRLDADKVRSGARLLIDQVMGEAGIHAPDLAATAIAQAEGDPIEAAFLLRAYRSTLPRVGYSLPLTGKDVAIRRRISSAFKDIPGGQVLGRTRDYTQRLLDVGGVITAQLLHQPQRTDAHENGNGVQADGAYDVDGAEGAQSNGSVPPAFPKVVDALRAEGLVARPARAEREAEPFDVTRDAPRFPAPRSARLQMLARGETGFMVALGYSSMRGYGSAHPAIAELRTGDLPVRIAHPLTGGAVTIGSIGITEVEAVNHASTGIGGGGSAEGEQSEYIVGYGAVLGQHERKAIAMAILDMSLDIPGNQGPLADEEFVLQHCDTLESSGFVEHLKLPHYVTFQAQLNQLRSQRSGARDNPRTNGTGLPQETPE